MLHSTVEQSHLRTCTHEVVVDVFGLVIRVTVKVICQETYGLHEREHASCVRQVLTLDVREESSGGLDVTLREGLEDVHVEADLACIRFILGGSIRSCPQEITEVGEYIARHDSIQVNDTENVAVLVEHHVVHLRIAMADAFRQFAVSVKLLGLAHFHAMLVDVLQH